MFEELSALTAIIGIVILMSVALMNGIDGVLLGASIAAIAGLGGFKVGQAFNKLIPKSP